MIEVSTVQFWNDEPTDKEFAKLCWLYYLSSLYSTKEEVTDFFKIIGLALDMTGKENRTLFRRGFIDGKSIREEITQ